MQQVKVTSSGSNTNGNQARHINHQIRYGTITGWRQIEEMGANWTFQKHAQISETKGPTGFKQTGN